MRRGIMLAVALIGGQALAGEAIRIEPSSAELLYSTYCIGCHTEQAHWRDKKQATTWNGLVAEVARWQANAGLDWSKHDVENVARYLNKLHYHYPQPN